MPLMPPMLPPPRAGMGGPFGGGGAGQTSLRLTRVQGTSALNGDPVSIYRIEVLRDGFFDKYLYLPNDSIVLYGLRVWQHREAIPNEIIKMVGGASQDPVRATQGSSCKHSTVQQSGALSAWPWFKPGRQPGSWCLTHSSTQALFWCRCHPVTHSSGSRCQLRAGACGIMPASHF
jgi:hypothetical protein